MAVGTMAAISQSELQGEPVIEPKKNEMPGQPDPRVEPKKNDTFGYRDPRIDVNLDNVVWNYGQIKKRVKVPVMAVVKANAYGHGLVEVSMALETAGVDWLMVGKLQEAVTLRSAGVKCPILNFGPFEERDCDEIVGRDISQSVYTEDARFLDAAGARLKKKASVQVDVDTGMSRTGIPHKQALPFIENIARFSQVKIDGVCTTLTEDWDFDREQLKEFLNVCTAAEKKGISLGLRHAASSDGLFRPPQFHLDMVRPGIMLYGYYPNAQTQKENRWMLKPALKLSATVLFIKELNSGESLSYLRAFKAAHNMRVATVGIGYSDGYAPQLGGKAFVSIRNEKYPVLAAVTSNHIMVDLNNNPEVQLGDAVTLIDPKTDSGLTADVVADWGGISDYKLLIGLSAFLPRTFSKTRHRTVAGAPRVSWI
jgi:alanine racemase